MKRRDLFKTGLMTLATLATGTKVIAAACKNAAAPVGKKVAKNMERLNYVLCAEDAKAHKKFKAGSNCENCNFYRADKKTPGYGKCPMIANKYVTAEGWCQSYRAKKKKS